MTEERQETLSALIYRAGVIADEVGRPGADFISWEEIWAAAQNEGIITTHVAGRTKLISIPASRRGPAVAGDALLIAQVATEAPLRKYRAPRFPHVPLAQDLGYLIKGLPYQQQRDILSILQADVQSGRFSLDSKGVSLLSATLEDHPCRIWTTQTANITIPNCRTLFNTILEIGGVKPAVREKLTIQLPKQATLERGMVDFSNYALRALLKEHGLDIQVDTSPLNFPSETTTVNARAVEKNVRQELIAALNIETAPWYPTLSGSVRKLLRNYTDLDPQGARKIWEKIVRNLPKVAGVVSFSPETFEEKKGEMPKEDVFLASLEPVTDLGIKLFDSATEGIRLNGGTSSDPLAYVQGKDALRKILETAARDEDMIIGFQMFRERADTGFLLKKLAQVAQDRGVPVPGLILYRPGIDEFDISIITALRQL